MSPGGPTLQADDYLLYLRCPRSLHARLTGRKIPDTYHADSLYPCRSDRSQVRALFRGLYPRGLDAGSDEARAAEQAYQDAADSEDPPEGGVSPTHPVLFGAVCTAGPFEARADIWHPQKPSGMSAGIVREATSVKHSYLVELAFLKYCFSSCGAEPARLFVYHLNKNYVRQGAVNPEEIFTQANVSKRVRLIYPDHQARLDALEQILLSDPTLSQFAEVPCDRPHSCPICSQSVEVPADDHLLNLYRGGRLARELIAEGYTSIPEVPSDRLVHPRQHIQRRSLTDRVPHIDVPALDAFLGSLSYPLYHLDFEAVSMAVPPFEGALPWEHIPYLFSVDRQEGPVADPTHCRYIMTPGEDQRLELAEALVQALGSEGSIVVYSASFERGIIRRLAELFPQFAESLNSAVERIVDLLAPFNEFSYYHFSQKGKVSLKTVLPLLTGYDYDDQAVKDGYTANRAYKYLRERADGGDIDEALVDDLVRYCGMDTMAMVHLVRRLRQITEGDGQEGSVSQG